MSSEPTSEPTSRVRATPQQVHRLVYAGFFAARDKIERAFRQADPRHDVEVWRAFARFTLLPLGVALVVIAFSLAMSSSVGHESNAHAASTAFLFGACAAAIVGLVNAGRRALLPLAVGVVAGGALIALAYEARIVHREDDVIGAVALVVLAVVAWALARAAATATPHEIDVDGDIGGDIGNDVDIATGTDRETPTAFLAPPSRARVAACVALWVLGGPIAFASFIAFMDEHDLGLPQLVIGLLLFIAGGVVTRLKRRLIVVRHAALLAFLTGNLYLVGVLMVHINVDRDMQPWLALPILVAGWLLVRSWPLRAAWGAALSAIVLVGVAEQRPSGVQFEDDVVFIAFLALTTLLLVRGARSRYLRPVFVAAGFAALVLSLVELPEVAADTGLNIGTATSIGAMACVLAATLVVLRGASKPARALVCGVLFLACALYIDAPGVVVAALVLLLARNARAPSLELFAFVAMLAHGWVIVGKPWADLEEHAIKAALTAVVLLAVGVTLRRVPVPLPSTAGDGRPES